MFIIEAVELAQCLRREFVSILFIRKIVTLFCDELNCHILWLLRLLSVFTLNIKGRLTLILLRSICE